MKCGNEGCNDEQKSKGYCLRHYKLLWRYGETTERGARHDSPDKRFWRYVDKSGECWNWTGHKDKDGYGTLTVKLPNGQHSPVRAHRFSMRLHGAEIADDALVLHRCNNPSCVNPDHLYVGSQVQNMRDRIEFRGDWKGEKHHNAKITEDDVIGILSFIGPAYKAAEQYGISASQARNIIKGRQWRHVYDRFHSEKKLMDAENVSQQSLF